MVLLVKHAALISGLKDQSDDGAVQCVDGSPVARTPGIFSVLVPHDAQKRQSFLERERPKTPAYGLAIQTIKFFLGNMLSPSSRHDLSANTHIKSWSSRSDQFC